MGVHSGVFILFILTGVIGWFGRPITREETTKIFRIHSSNFLIAYAAGTIGDQFINPYGPILFHSYHFTPHEWFIIYHVAYIFYLFVMPQLGALADCYGRKLACLLSCAIYMLICVLAHFRYVGIMTTGVCLAYTCQAMWAACSEAWLVHEHVVVHNFSGGLLTHMFAMMGVVRSASGIFAHTVVAIVIGLVSQNREIFKGVHFHIGGINGTFEMGFVVIAVSFVLIRKWWGESFGHCGNHAPGHLAFMVDAAKVLCTDRRVLLLGGAAASFNGAIYVLMTTWPHAMHLGDEAYYNGMLLAAMAMCTMCGNAISTALSARLPCSFRTSVAMLGVCFCFSFLGFFVIMNVGGRQEYRRVSLLAILYLMCTAGFCTPILGVLKGDIVPDRLRCTIYVYFQIPGVLLQHHCVSLKPPEAYALCLAALLVAIVCIVALGRTVPNSDAGNKDITDVDAFYQRVTKVV